MREKPILSLIAHALKRCLISDIQKSLY